MSGYSVLEGSHTVVFTAQECVIVSCSFHDPPRLSPFALQEEDVSLVVVVVVVALAIVVLCVCGLGFGVPVFTHPASITVYLGCSKTGSFVILAAK